MKATGIVRKIDALGRVVIPKEMRDNMYIEDGDPLEIYVEGDAILIKKYNAICVFCGSSENLKDFHGRAVCPECIEHMKHDF